MRRSVLWKDHSDSSLENSRMMRSAMELPFRLRLREQPPCWGGWTVGPTTGFTADCGCHAGNPKEQTLQRDWLVPKITKQSWKEWDTGASAGVAEA